MAHESVCARVARTLSGGLVETECQRHDGARKEALHEFVDIAHAVLAAEGCDGRDERRALGVRHATNVVDEVGREALHEELPLHLPTVHVAVQ